MPTYSLSYSAQDAIFVDPEDGSYVFQTAAPNPRMGVRHVSLGTLELPLAQFPVESGRNKLHFGEGHHFDAHADNNCLAFTETLTGVGVDGGDTVTRKATVAVPGHHNAILEIQCAPTKVALSENIQLVEQKLATLGVESNAHRTALEEDLETLREMLQQPGVAALYDLEVSTAHPHRLWALPPDADASTIAMPSQGANLVQEWGWGHPLRMVGTSIGDVVLDPERLEFVNPRKFVLRGVRLRSPSAGWGLGSNTPKEIRCPGYLHAPRLPGPLQLARVLHRGLAHSGLRATYEVTAHAGHGGLVIRCHSFGEGARYSCGSLELSIEDGAMARSVGLADKRLVLVLGSGPSVITSTTREDCSLLAPLSSVEAPNNPSHPRLAVPKSVPTMALSSHASDLAFGNVPDNRAMVGAPFTLDVGVGALPPGWYDISNRPVGATATHSIGEAWATALRPLHFPMAPPNFPLRDPESEHPLRSQWFLCFRDSIGCSHAINVPSGSYSTTTLCRFLSLEMTAAAQRSGARDVRVRFCRGRSSSTGQHKGRFQFTCVDHDDGDEVGSTYLAASDRRGDSGRFALDFTNPRNTVPPRRLGFRQQLYTGSTDYLSPEEVWIPRLGSGEHHDGGEAPPQGDWHVQVEGTTRQLRFSCQPGPDVFLVIDAALTKEATRLAQEIRAEVHLACKDAGDCASDLLRVVGVLGTTSTVLGFHTLGADGRPYAHGQDHNGSVVLSRSPCVTYPDKMLLVDHRNGASELDTGCATEDWRPFPFTSPECTRPQQAERLTLRVWDSGHMGGELAAVIPNPSPRLATLLREAAALRGSTNLFIEAPSDTAVLHKLREQAWVLRSQTAVFPSLYFSCPGGAMLEHNHNSNSESAIRLGALAPEMLGLPVPSPNLPSDAVGFDDISDMRRGHAALVWGSVGDVMRGGEAGGIRFRSWPLSSWSVYQFDPPEILLVFLNEGCSKSTSQLRHVAGHKGIVAPFARINLGSLHREGGLRAEVLSHSCEPLNMFRLRFANPDGSTYRMHNSNFRFTLNVTA